MHVQADCFYVAAHEVTGFCFPGDSGKLVIDRATGDLLGMVSELVLNNSTYLTKVVPLWCFFGWLTEDVIDVVKSYRVG